MIDRRQAHERELHRGRLVNGRRSSSRSFARPSRSSRLAGWPESCWRTTCDAILLEPDLARLAQRRSLEAFGHESRAAPRRLPASAPRRSAGTRTGSGPGHDARPARGTRADPCRVSGRSARRRSSDFSRPISSPRRRDGPPGGPGLTVAVDATSDDRPWSAACPLRSAPRRSQAGNSQPPQDEAQRRPASGTTASTFPSPLAAEDRPERDHNRDHRTRNGHSCSAAHSRTSHAQPAGRANQVKHILNILDFSTWFLLAVGCPPFRPRPAGRSLQSLRWSGTGRCRR